jgi:hypothetical protein
VTTLYALTLIQATTNLRTDLNDPTGAGSRWQDTDLQRALDRAVERITAVEPDLEEIQLQTQQAVRTYLKPTGALWIDRVEYPAGQWPPSYPAFTELRSPQILAPLLAPTVSLRANAGSTLPAGIHYWGYTYVTAGFGETTLSPTISLNVPAGQEADLTIGLIPDGVIAVYLYRTASGLTQLKKLDSIAPPTTTYTDLLGDGALSVNAPTINNTGATDLFRLEIPPEQYPPDAVTYFLSVRYALKHELDSNGTTIPERHWDTLYAGAKVAAIDIYLANINDNFVYADGQLRDRVDDTKSVEAWRSYRDLLEQAFVARLKQIRDEQIQSSRFTPAWGDKPLRWEKV